MPTPNTVGASPVSSANTAQPFTTPTVRPGAAGLNLRKAIDLLAPTELSRMQNLTWTQEGGLQTRPGLTLLSTAAGENIVHSIGSLRDPKASPASGHYRVLGVDEFLYLQPPGDAVLDKVSGPSAFSGGPMMIVPYRPPLSADPWAFIADSNLMWKVNKTGANAPIGLPAPTAALSVAVAASLTTAILDFNGDAGDWEGHKGSGEAVNPVATDHGDGGPPGDEGGDHVGFPVTQAGSSNYYQFFSREATLDLSKLDDGEVDATDDDHIHLWLKVSEPKYLTEARIYFIVSDDFDDDRDKLPGTESNFNTEFYVRSITGGDLAEFISGDKSAAELVDDIAAEKAHEEAILRNEDIGLDPGEIDFEVSTETGSDEGGGIFMDNDGNIVEYNPTTALPRKFAIGAEGPSGSHEWIEFGVAGRPFRRGDFRRVGENPDFDWSTVTGIVIYVGGVADQGVKLYLDDMYLRGGCGPDTSHLGTVGYDYRYTHFDYRTGAESNPNPILPDAEPYGEFPVRDCVTLDPDPFGSSDAWNDDVVRQRFYRRGGTLGNNWYFVGQNGADGEAFTDDKSDIELVNADTLQINHAQPVQTLDTDGTIVRAQPVPALWGPIQDILFACGDKYRPGHLYWSNPGEPDHWSPYNTFEVCSPSEELMTGGYFGGQGFVFSRERMYWIYPNLGSPGSVTVTPSPVAKGLFSRYGLAVGDSGIFFVNRDGVWRTNGGPPELISAPLGDEDDGGIFSGSSVNGYAAIDWKDEQHIRLEIWGTEVWFQYRDTGGNNRHLIWDSLGNRWKYYTYFSAGNDEPGTIFADETEPYNNVRMLVGGRRKSTDDAGGKIYEHIGTSDNTEAISAVMRTGAWDAGEGRAKKLFGDLFVDMNRDETTIQTTTFLDNETITNSAQNITSGSGRTQYILDSFGTTPQRGQNVSIQIDWSAAARVPRVQQIGVSVSPEPEETVLRVTRWDDLGSANEKYVMGIMLECDTKGEDRTVIAEAILGSTTTTVDTWTINTSGRQRTFRTWTAVQADRIRIRPITTTDPWLLYQCSWVAQQEPPRIAKVDSHFEVHANSYYTGLVLSINTFGVAKTFNIYVDETALTNPETGTTSFSVNTTGRRVVHLHLSAGRGHVFRFVSTDSNTCLLYNHEWQLDQEPAETANWGQNWTIANTHADKYIKGVKLECDTFGEDKTVLVEIDGAIAATLTINANDRRVVHEAFAQVRGRVVRIRATDNNPGRLYSASLIFDEEPLGLDRWETQELTLGAPGWKTILEGWVTYRSSAAVTMQVTAMREDGTSQVKTYTLPDTSSVKRQHYVTFEAVKGVQFKFLFTSGADFWLYRAESVLKLADWGGQIRGVQPFGDDNLDLVRSIQSAEINASLPYKSQRQSMGQS